jgi:hypothetical protein
LSLPCRFPPHLIDKLVIVDGVFYSCLPFLITFIFSSLTLIKLVSERRKFRNEYVLPQCMLEHRTSSFRSRQNSSNSNTYNENSSNGNRVSQRRMSRRRRVNRLSKLKLSFMLMTFPLSFLVTTFPVFVIITLRLLASYSNLFIFDTDYESVFAIAKTFMYANNSFNIFLYILLGKSLRRDLIKLFRCSKLDENSNSIV